MGDVFLIFGINWVMLRTVATLLFCWRNWFGKHGSVIWNMVLGCLMWIVRKEWNGHLFEDNVISSDQLKSVFQHTLWAWCWDFSDCSSIFEFLASLRLAL